MTIPPNGTLIYRHKWIRLCEGFRDTPYIYFESGAVAVVLNSVGELLLVVEPTAYDNRPVLVLPGGGIEDGENPDVTINRELCEEIGFRAERLDYLGTLYPFSKYLAANISLYLARELVPESLDGDESYEIAVEHIPFARFEDAIADGRLQDSSTIAGLYMARAFLAAEEA